MMEPKALTLQEFTRLSPCWPEYIMNVPFWSGKGILIARIHPNCNRHTGDDDVLARALVYQLPDDIDPAGGLRRLTIRRCNIESLGANEFGRERAKMYRACLDAIMTLPVLDLTNAAPGLSWDFMKTLAQ